MLSRKSRKFINHEIVCFGVGVCNLSHPAPTPRFVNVEQTHSERISTTPFLLWHFSLGDKTENCSAQFLAVCWIVHVEFKVHRLRDGFSVSNPLLLSQSLPTFIGHNLDKIRDALPAEQRMFTSYASIGASGQNAYARRKSLQFSLTIKT